jgi:hypothetical protein
MIQRATCIAVNPVKCTATALGAARSVGRGRGAGVGLVAVNGQLELDL